MGPNAAALYEKEDAASIEVRKRFKNKVHYPYYAYCDSAHDH